ncbi:SLATT domain-containing protein [Streptomyces rubellomurinus]|uniref:SLATT domain-containing protein n=1 Tax=Streptomyces rubellomurinus (strain ATCC 31215) TaxID=359131 RepID=UPI000A6527DE|nr:SLATT domain-containing protein [Streptomyces rubellomurinus]
MSSVDEGGQKQLAAGLRRRRREAEAKLTLRRRLNRSYAACSATVACSMLVGSLASVVAPIDGTVQKIDAVCLVLLLAFGVAGLVIKRWDHRSAVPRLVDAETQLEVIQNDLRWVESGISNSVTINQNLYRADIAGIIDGFQSGSDKYRRRHNRLQSIIIVASLGTTTVAALQDAVPGHQWLTVGLSLLVGGSTGFMGYYKFRERSFYLQQSADQVEAEHNAMILSVGDYRGLSQPEALARLVERVEQIRNEQRRRQQQLDQPAGGQALEPGE